MGRDMDEETGSEWNRGERGIDRYIDRQKERERERGSVRERERK